jgi:hypothetical protein
MRQFHRPAVAGVLLASLAALSLAGCGNKAASFSKQSPQDQEKAFRGKEMPPEVAAKIAEARAKGAQAGQAAAAKAQSGGGR